MDIKGTELFVKALREEGVDTVFGYPGGMAIDLFDALYDAEDIEVILPRHEQALVHEADGYARSTGKVGVCLVTSGPGATNLVTGIATANFDSVPLVCFTGQVSRDLIGNDAFQEIDIVGVTRNICKYAVTVRDRKDLASIIKKAFYVARTGKPGPVIVDIPKDIQLEAGSDEYPSEIFIRGYKPSSGVHVGQLKKAMTMLKAAKKPVFLIGGGVRISGAGAELTKLAERMRIPVITTIMGKGAIPTDHPLYVGNIGMYGNYASNNAVSKCDVLFAIGVRFSDRITGRIEDFAPNAKIIHVDIDTASISRNIVVNVPIVADAKTAIEEMLKHSTECRTESWIEEINRWKGEKPINMNNCEGMTPEKIIRGINEIFPDSIVVTDVGQNQLWTTQFLEMNGKRQLLTSGGLGTMGYGLPAAIGASLGNPRAPVICISGDGGAQMNIQELATASALETPVVFCIFNNTFLGNVKQMQKMFYNKRYSSTCLRYTRSCNRQCEIDGTCAGADYLPDFVKLAESYRADGIRVMSEEEIGPAFRRAAANTNKPTVIEFMIDCDYDVYPMVPGGKALTDMLFG
ncbi:MAG: biosynthetic-type acetolactate synthase large subunit [Butyrivibrio sp.]|nr:biosynthetic-type acetolactate synthase large subunit [Butyrivibrio sp.]